MSKVQQILNMIETNQIICSQDDRKKDSYFCIYNVSSVSNIVSSSIIKINDNDMTEIVSTVKKNNYTETHLKDKKMTMYEKENCKSFVVLDKNNRVLDTFNVPHFGNPEITFW